MVLADVFRGGRFLNLDLDIVWPGVYQNGVKLACRQVILKVKCDCGGGKLKVVDQCRVLFFLVVTE